LFGVKVIEKAWCDGKGAPKEVEHPISSLVEGGFLDILLEEQRTMWLKSWEPRDHAQRAMQV